MGTSKETFQDFSHGNLVVFPWNSSFSQGKNPRDFHPCFRQWPLPSSGIEVSPVRLTVMAYLTLSACEGLSRSRKICLWDPVGCVGALNIVRLPGQNSEGFSSSQEFWYTRIVLPSNCSICGLEIGWHHGRTAHGFRFGLHPKSFERPRTEFLRNSDIPPASTSTRESWWTVGSLGFNAGEQLLPLAQIKVGEEAEGGCGHGWVAGFWRSWRWFSHTDGWFKIDPQLWEWTN